MVSKPFKGYALAPNRRGTVFLVRGADKNSRIVFQGGVCIFESKARARGLRTPPWQFVKIAATGAPRFRRGPPPLTIGRVLGKKFWPGRLFGPLGPLGLKESLGTASGPSRSGGRVPRTEYRIPERYSPRYSTVAKRPPLW